MFLGLMALSLAAAGDGQVVREGTLPERTDLVIAQADYINSLLGENGMVHCNKFKDFVAQPTEQANIVKVRYKEYVSKSRWKRMKATLRTDGEDWIWVDGDKPRCSIIIIRED